MDKIYQIPVEFQGFVHQNFSFT